MIKILKQYSLLAGLVRHRKVFSFVETKQLDEENKKKSLRVQSGLMTQLKNHKTLSGLINFHLQKGVNDPSRIKFVCQEIIRLKNTPRMWNDSRSVAFLLDRIANQQKLEPHVFALAGGLISIASESTSMREQTISKLIRKAQQYLKQPQLISSENLINLLRIAYAKPSYTKFINEIFRILQSRIKFFNQSTWGLLLKTLNRRRYLTEDEQEMLKYLQQKIIRQVDKISLMNLIQYYKTIKHQNMQIWGMDHAVKMMEKKIFRDFSKLNPKQIFATLGYRNYFNRFSQYIFQDVIDSINENGESKEDDVFIFKVLSMMADGLNECSLTQKQQEKVLRFFSRRIDNKETIFFFLSKNLISKPNLVKFSQIINQSFYREIYTFSPLYTLTLLENDIPVEINDENLRNIFEEQCNSRVLTNSFMSVSLLIHEARVKFPDNNTYKQFHNDIQKHIQKMGLNLLKVYRMKQKTIDDTYNKFIKIYGKLFESAVDAQIKTSEFVVSQFIVTFLIKTNDMGRLNELMNTKRYKQSMAMNISSLIEETYNFPFKFIGSYETIFNLLIIQLGSTSCTPALQLKIQMFMCNWQIHVQLTQPEAQVFMQAAFSLILKQPRINKSFCSYILNSPSKYIKQNQTYFHFLEHMQGSLDISNYDEAGVDYDLLVELIRLNLVSQRFAKKMLLCCIQVSGVVKQYLTMIVEGEKADPTIFPYDQQSFLLLVKNKKIDSDYLTKYMNQILKLIPGCNIEDILLNFQLKPNKSSDLILEKLVEEYLKQFQGKFEGNIKLFYIISKLWSLQGKVEIRDKLMKIANHVDSGSKNKINFFSKLKLRCTSKAQ